MYIDLIFKQIFMMRTFFTITTLLLSTAGLQSFAQASRLEKPAGKTPVYAQSGNKGTGTESRLVASAEWYFDTALEPLDSFYTTYTGQNGYDFNIDDWKYTSAKGWEYNGTSYDENYRLTRTFDVSNRITASLGEQFDGSAWTPSYTERYTFNTAGLIDVNVSGYYNGSQWDSSRYTYVYDAKGRVIDQVTESWNTSGSNWDKTNRMLTIYNTADLVEMSYGMNWTTSWDTSSRTVYNYTSNKLNSRIYQSKMGGIWTDMYMDTMTYDGTGKMIQSEGKSWNGTAWEPQQRITNTYNTANDLVTEINENYQGSAYVYSSQVLYTYNSYHQPLTETNKTWNSATSKFEFDMGDYETYNYYEEFTNGVGKFEIVKGSINVYPMPAVNQLNISLNWNKTQASALVLYDMNGRVVKRINLAAAIQSNCVMDISTLPAGTYTLKVTGTDGSLSKNISIIK